MHAQYRSEKLYGTSLALLTDLYELTMAYGYWKKGMEKKRSVFHLFFRKKPFKGEYAIAAGLETLVEYIQHLHFTDSDIAYLQMLRDSEGNPLFEEAFLAYLQNFSFTCDIDAVLEGTVVFPYEPFVRVTGPILQAQLLESVILNIMNFQTLIATKASRVCFAAGADPVVEFGLRRAQGVDGGMSASRAAYIGGCESTSNVLAGKFYDIPVKGTHAHSWIMAFDDELSAFYAYSDVLPYQCIFLVDTYDSVAGTRNAIRVAHDLRKKGIEMAGIRLDSGDLSQLSIEIRKLLDDAGFPKAKIMASNELDEFLLRDLKHQGAKIDIWGVGTNLVTGKDQPALDGVYKLSALEDGQGKWLYKVKISEQWAKMTNPGILQVRRYYSKEGFLCDMIYDVELKEGSSHFLDPFDPVKVLHPSSDWQYEDLLVPIMRQGELVYQFPSLQQVRSHASQQLQKLSSATRRFLNPQTYVVGLEKSLYELKLQLIKEVKNKIG